MTLPLRMDLSGLAVTGRLMSLDVLHRSTSLVLANDERRKQVVDDPDRFDLVSQFLLNGLFGLAYVLWAFVVDVDSIERSES